MTEGLSVHPYSFHGKERPIPGSRGAPWAPAVKAGSFSQAHTVRPYDKAGNWRPFLGVGTMLEAYNPPESPSETRPPLHKGGLRAPTCGP